jgi:hypothetical protein
MDIFADAGLMYNRLKSRHEVVEGWNIFTEVEGQLLCSTHVSHVGTYYFDSTCGAAGERQGWPFRSFTSTPH